MAQDAALQVPPANSGNQPVADFLGGTNIDVQQCYSCGGTHNHVACRPYAVANPPYTHWYACPDNGDPLPIAIVLFGGNPLEVNNRILRDIARAQHGGSVLFATFGIDKKGGVHLERHTHRFPSDRLLEAVELLKKDLAKEAPLPEPTEPLPRADLSALFGRPKIASGQVATEPGASDVVARNGAGSTERTAEAEAPEVEEHGDDQEGE